MKRMRPDVAFTMTLNLSQQEADALAILAIDKGLNKTQVIRQALRLYQLVTERKLEWRDPAQPKKAMDIVIL